MNQSLPVLHISKSLVLLLFSFLRLCILYFHVYFYINILQVYPIVLVNDHAQSQNKYVLILAYVLYQINDWHLLKFWQKPSRHQLRSEERRVGKEWIEWWR